MNEGRSPKESAMRARKRKATSRTEAPFVVGPAAKKVKMATSVSREEEPARLLRIAERVNYGLSLDDTLDFAWDELKGVIPYSRIGFSFIDEARGVAVARWARSDRPMKLVKGFTGKLEGSTLERILKTGRPRIINDLGAYLAKKPSSISTRLLVQEGMRSSLTCPLVVQGRPVGFLFFTSPEPNAYAGAHVEFFRRIAGMLSAVVEKSRLYTELADRQAVIERQNELMTRDLEMARDVQRALVPSEPPKLAKLDVAFVYEPATSVGGDVLDVIPVDDRRTLFFLGDAVGHGVPAALVMSVVKASLRAAAAVNPSPATVLDSVNHALATLLSSHFVTAAAALVDTEARSFELALAGHAPPILLRTATGEDGVVGDGDLPLGVSGETRYKPETVRMEPGDVFVMTTDGITETLDSDEDQYGVEGLRDCVVAAGCESASDLVKTILRDVDRHSGGREAKDDRTLLVVKFIG